MISFIIKNKKKIDYLAYAIFLFFSFVNLFFINISFYIYLIFIIVSFLFLKEILNFDNSFGIIFFFILILLGFWFKFTIISIFFNSNFGEGIGFFDFTKNSMNEVILVSAIFKLAILSAHFIFLKKKFKFKEIKLFYIQKFCSTNYTFLVFIIPFFVIASCYFNFVNEIFLRSHPINENFLFLLNYFKFFYKIFAPFLIYFLIDLSLKSNFSLKKIFFIFIYLTLVLNIIYSSQLSREVGLHIIIFLYSFIFIYKKSGNQIQNKYFNILLSSFLICFIINLYIVQYARLSGISLIDDITIEQKILNNNISLIFNRWVGVDAVIAVASNIEKSWKLFYEIANNQISWTNKVAWPFTNYFVNKVHVNTPGPAAFLYSTGSYIFLFSVTFMIFILFLFLCHLIRLLGNNFIFSSNFLMYALAFRFIHMGLGIYNLIYFILSIFFLIIAVVTINLYLKIK